MEENNNGYGGLWTVEKLEILTLYLQMYTAALKEKFRLAYIDAFAGSGSLSYRVDGGLNFRDAGKLYEGSARRAVAIDENPFDYLVFVEKDERRYKKLQRIKSENPNRNITVFNKDANEYLQSLSIRPGSNMRGVLFLDPFATEVEWDTIKAIARYKTFDTWLLFPTSAIVRMLPTKWSSDSFDTVEAKALTRVFGNDSWKRLYMKEDKGDLWGDRNSHQIRASGVEPILNLFKERLFELLGPRFLRESRSLYNTKKVPIFEFLFFVGSSSPRAIKAAKDMALYLIKKHRF